MPRLLSLVLLTILSGFARAEDWPQWLGPRRDGTSTAKVAPWKEPPKVLWRVPVGEGHSSPVVAGGRVFLHVKIREKDDEEVLALRPLAHLAHEVVAFELALPVPANLASGEKEAALCRDAVGVALGPCPVGRLQGRVLDLVWCAIRRL